MAISDLHIVIGLAPVPAARPRVAKFGTYYPPTYKAWKKDARWFMPKVSDPLQGPLAVDMEIICKRPQKPTSSIPVGDVDNYAKAALDAVNDATIWGDDKQVVSMHVSKRYAEPGEEPCTIINIKHMENKNAKH